MYAPTDPESPAPPLSFWQACFWGWAALGVFELLLPLYGRTLGASATTIGALFGVFSITGLALRVLLGPLLDRIRRTTAFQVGLAIYVVALILFAFAQTVPMLFAARLLQGLGSTATWLTAAVLVGEWGREHRGALFGRFLAIGVWGSAAGSIWSGIAALLFDGETRTALAGAIALPQWLPTVWTPLAVLHLIFAGNTVFACIALLAAFRLREPPRTRLTDTRLRLTIRPLWDLLAVGFLSGAAGGSLLPVLVLLIEDHFRSGIAGIAVVYAVPGIVYAFAPTPLGRWTDHHGYRRGAILGLMIPAFAYVLLPVVSILPAAAVLLCVEAIGLSLATPSLNALVAERLPERRGNAYGLFSTAGGLGSALAAVAGGWLYEHAGVPIPFFLAAGLTISAALVAFWVIKRPSST